MTTTTRRHGDVDDSGSEQRQGMSPKLAGVLIAAFSLFLGVAGTVLALQGERTRALDTIARNASSVASLQVESRDTGKALNEISTRLTRIEVILERIDPGPGAKFRDAKNAATGTRVD